MSFSDEFADITTAKESLAPFTTLRLGGAAQWFVQPRSRDELAAVLRRCEQNQLPFRVIGVGSNLLISDEGVSGVVLRLASTEFTQITTDGRQLRAGSGASLSALISSAARHDLTGFEGLVGIPGTVGGALRCTAGDRSDAIGQWVRRVEVMTAQGQIETRDRDDLFLSEHESNLDDVIILAVEFELDRDNSDAIVKRLRRAWIQRKANQPLTFQRSARLFKNPRGFTAAGLIEQAGLSKTRVGGAELSERNANYVIAQPGASARDVARLLELVQARVRETCGIALERELMFW